MTEEIPLPIIKGNVIMQVCGCNECAFCQIIAFLNQELEDEEVLTLDLTEDMLN